MTRPPLLTGHRHATAIGRFTGFNEDGTITAELEPHVWMSVVAHQLYGRGWQSKLAIDLGVDRSTVWRMANGRKPVSGHAMPWLKELMLRAERAVTAPGAS